MTEPESPATEGMDRVFCPRCRTHHAAVVRLESGFPATEWAEPHRGEVLNRLVTSAGVVMAQAVSDGDLDLAEEAASAALELLDPEDEEEGGDG
jgi:hypothetical protein